MGEKNRKICENYKKMREKVRITFDIVKFVYNYHQRKKIEPIFDVHISRNMQTWEGIKRKD